MDLVGKTFYEATNYFKKELDSLLIAVERVEENGLTEQHVNPFRDYELLEGDRLTLIIKRNSSICDL